MLSSMNSDLQKLVQAGKIPADFATRLDKFSPGKYVLHQEMGVGKVAAWSLPQQKVKVAFEHGRDHVMGLKLAFNSLTPIPDGHFFIACYDDPEGCYKKASDKKTIKDFMRDIINGNKSLREGIDEVLPLLPDDLERFLSGRVIPAKEWKGWWDKARAAMREDPGFRLPTKRGEAIALRHAASAAEALLEDFLDAKTLESCVRILDQAHLDVLKGEYEIAARLVKKMEEDFQKAHDEPQRVLELIIIRDEILDTIFGSETEKAKLDEALKAAEETSITSLADKLKTITSKEIVEYIGELNASRQREVYKALAEAYGDACLSYAINIFLFGGSKVTAPVADFIIAKGGREQLFSVVSNGLARQNLAPDVLMWACKERNGLAKELVNKTKMVLGSALIAAIERDNAEGGPNRALRLRNMLLEDKTLAPDLVSGVSELEARPFAKAIYNSSVLPELDRNLLLANMMKVQESLHDIVKSGLGSKEKQSMYVSLRSFAARKAEYEDIINVRIPKNKHDLEVTRAEGDLRENGGYQDAKATRQVLTRRSVELSRLLSQAVPTDFANVTCEEVSMGTKVTFVTEDGQEVVYIVLGAWDSVPEQHIISYSSRLGAKLLGHKVGEVLRLPLEIGGDQVKMTIKSIEPAPKELIFPDETPEEA